MLLIAQHCREFLKNAQYVSVPNPLPPLPRLPDGSVPTPRQLWSRHPEYPQRLTARAVEWVFVSDLLNFSFWADGEKNSNSNDSSSSDCTKPLASTHPLASDSTHCTNLLDEITTTSASSYAQFISCLNRNAEILCDPLQYAHLSFPAFSGLFPPNLPLLPERHAILTQAGHTLIDYFRGSFAYFLGGCGGGAEFVAKVCQYFPSFRDAGEGELWLLKRLQILVADLWVLSLGESVPGESVEGCLGESEDILEESNSAITSPEPEPTLPFDEEFIEQLTIFPDYRIPQMLWYLGALSISPALQELLHQRVLFPAHSRPVVEMRAAAVVAGEELKKAAGLRTAVQLDYYLWEWSQHLKGGEWEERFPFHRTRSIYY